MLLPSPDAKTLNWLARGRLADRILRSIRLWFLINLLYSSEPSGLPRPFRYGAVRDRLFASTHSADNNANAAALSAHCTETCICQQTVKTLFQKSAPAMSITDWQQNISALSDLSATQTNTTLEQRPFATVHRSIRDDLRHLSELGWLENKGQGRFCLIATHRLPQIESLPASVITNGMTSATSGLSSEEMWEIVRSLESIAFVRPNLEIIIHTLWEQLTEQTKTIPTADLTTDNQRIFIHLDYVLSKDMQDKVDTLQEQIERLWREGGGIVQFDYSQKSGRTLPITVYPVCLHYARRAKYLSAYGQDPFGTFGWHNYRLDRITSPRLTILQWNTPQVPPKLQAMHELGTLPSSEAVSKALKEAWGFNFYLPRRLLIMRFSPEFAQRYVQETDRHATFEPVAYHAIPDLVKQAVEDTEEQAAILKILSQKKESDRYYRAWIRLGDINIVMRLRDWRPNGEVIAPLTLRKQMREEAQQECDYYKK